MFCGRGRLRTLALGLLRQSFMSKLTSLSRGRAVLSMVVGLSFAGAAIACGEPEAADGDEPKASASGTADAGAPGTSPGFGGGAPSGDAGGGTSDDPNECGKMDIVFVVDNSGSMAQEQANLAANFPKFASIIDGYKTKGGKSLDYRVAVTTSDAMDGRGGAFVASSSGCDSGPKRPWLERTDPSVVDFFACRAKVGTRGSGLERPLASLLLGLTDRVADGTNKANGASFLRDDALLAFVVLTDEDEFLPAQSPFGGGSTSKLPATIAEFPPAFDKLKDGERGRWASAVIAGDKACSSLGLGSAAEARELKAFTAQVGKNGVFASICTGDLTEGLTKALATFDLACKSFPTGPN